METWTETGARHPLLHATRDVRGASQDRAGVGASVFAAETKLGVETTGNGTTKTQRNSGSLSARGILRETGSRTPAAHDARPGRAAAGGYRPEGS